MRRLNLTHSRRASARRLRGPAVILLLGTAGFAMGTSLRSSWDPTIRLSSQVMSRGTETTVSLVVEGVPHPVAMQFLDDPSRLGVRDLEVSDHSGRPLPFRMDYEMVNSGASRFPSLAIEQGADSFRIDFVLKAKTKFDAHGSAFRRTHHGKCLAAKGKSFLLLPRVDAKIECEMAFRDRSGTRHYSFDQSDFPHVFEKIFVAGFESVSPSLPWRLHLGPAMGEYRETLVEQFAQLREVVARRLPHWLDIPMDLCLVRRKEGEAPLMNLSSNEVIVLDSERPHRSLWLEFLRAFVRQRLEGDWVCLGLAEHLGDQFLQSFPDSPIGESLLAQCQSHYQNEPLKWDLDLRSHIPSERSRMVIFEKRAVKSALILQLLDLAMEEAGAPEGMWGVVGQALDSDDFEASLERSMGSEFAQLVGEWAARGGLGIPRARSLSFRESPTHEDDLTPTTELSVVFSGDGEGLLETCGCDSSNSGGLARRSGAIHALRNQGLEPLVIDLGRTVTSRGPRSLSASENTEQNLYLELLDLIGVDATIMGTAALQRGTKCYETWFGSRRMARLGVNVFPRKLAAPWTLVVRNGMRIGVVGYSDPSGGLGDDYVFGGSENRCGLISDPTLLSNVVKSMEGVDLVVLAGNVGIDTLSYVLEECADRIDVVLSLDLSLRSIVPIGQRALMGGFVEEGPLVLVHTLNSQGLSIADLQLNAAGKVVGFRANPVKLDAQVIPDPQVQARLDDFYREGVLREIAQGAQVVPIREGDSAFEGGFVGSEACMSCHSEQADHYRGTDHASAFNTLIRVGRQSTIQCTPCHVVGYGHNAGWDPRSPEVHLRDVGCESCHGAGAAHVQSPSQSNIRKTPTQETCTSCHDPKHSPRFWGEFEARWKKIKH